MELRHGYKKTEIGVVPYDWQIFNFGDLIDYTKGYPFKSSEYVNDGIRVIRVSDTTLDSIKDNGAVFVSYQSKHFYKKWCLKENDLIVSTVGSKPPMYDSLVGRMILVNRKYSGSLLNQNAVIIRAKEFTHSFQELLLNHFKTNRYIQHIEIVFRGNANQASITLSDLFMYKIPVPPTKAEQTAIANALSDADAWIQSLIRLIEKKKQIKQGAMQKLLNPYENGKLKDGWVVRKLGDISKIGRGRVISHHEINKSIERKYPVYSSQTSNNGTMGYIDSYDFDGEYITWTTDGENAGMVFYRNGKFNCTNVCGTIKLFEGNAIFISFFLGTITPRLVSRNLANPKLMNEPVKKIMLPLPSDNEQFRIANFIVSLDSEITKLETKLEKAKQIKQGMMQNLLTGKIRLI